MVKDSPFSHILGNSAEMQTVKTRIKKVAPGASNILITGESGTGKELFARAAHCMSDRANQPFIPVNCAAIPESLLESELFGYEEGAFTGARKGGKVGKFQLANGGTLFLDEIGDLQLQLQGKLLRVLQERLIDPIGGKERISVDVRIITATNKELHELVDQGLFRADLFYRINVIPIRIPALRERRDDVLLLANYFLSEFNHKMRKCVRGFSPAVVQTFMAYQWPGNVRELENVIEYAMNMVETDQITLEDLSARFQNYNHRRRNDQYEKVAFDMVMPLEEVIRKEIMKALDIYGKTKTGITQAAGVLGISTATLYRKLKKYC